MDGNNPIVIIVGTTKGEDVTINNDIDRGVILASPGNRNISLDQATAFTANYRNRNEEAKRGGSFNLQAINAVLYDYPDPAACTALIMQHGLSNDNQRQLIVRGSKTISSNTYAINSLAPAQNDTINGRIIDMSFPCPKDCGKRNSLNGL